MFSTVISLIIMGYTVPTWVFRILGIICLMLIPIRIHSFMQYNKQWNETHGQYIKHRNLYNEWWDEYYMRWNEKDFKDWCKENNKNIQRG